MTQITRQDVEQLAANTGSPRVSLYLPTHRRGNEVLQREDAIVLKGQLKESRNLLSNAGLEAEKIDRILAPAQHLVHDGEFWRRQEEGLAIFLGDGFHKELILPFRVPERVEVANGFYLLPLLPFFNKKIRFYILDLEIGAARLFACTRWQMEEINASGHIPQGIEEVVGADYEQKSLQFRNLKGGREEAIYHGHGEGKDESKMEITKYFRAVDEGVKELIGSKTDPLLVACSPHLFPLYHEVNKYNRLVSEPLDTPGDAHVDDLHRRAIQVLREELDRILEEKRSQFHAWEGTGKTGNGIGEVLPAVLEGRVDTLFIRTGADSHGRYDKASGQVIEAPENGGRDQSLYNSAGVATFLRNGSVYLLPEDGMPDSAYGISALYRY